MLSIGDWVTLTPWAPILGMHPAKRAREGVRALWDGEAMVTGIVLEELDVEPVVFSPEIVLLATVPSLGDVVRHAWQNQARRPGNIEYSGDLPPKILRGSLGTEVFDPAGLRDSLVIPVDSLNSVQ